MSTSLSELRFTRKLVEIAERVRTQLRDVTILPKHGALFRVLEILRRQFSRQDDRPEIEAMIMDQFILQLCFCVRRMPEM